MRSIQMQQPPPSILDRYRPVVYSFIAGLLVGMLIGWFYHGFVGLLIRILVLIPLLILVVAAVMFWRGTTRQREHLTRSRDIEARWREGDRPGGDRGS
jgi:F0F1-type ATP synthase assembly protein I